MADDVAVPGQEAQQAEPAPHAQPPPQVDPEPSGAEAVQVGMLLSAIRCVITYVLLPGAAAATGATGSTARLAVGLQVLGAGFAVFGSFRLWRTRHPWRWAYTAVAVVIVAMTVSALRSL